MLINIFDDYQTARNACVAYQRCGKRHQGLRGVEYRVYFYNGKYRVWRGRDYTEIENYLDEKVIKIYHRDYDDMLVVVF